MQFRYPLVKVEIVDLFVGDKKKGEGCKRMYKLRVFFNQLDDR